MTVIKFLETGAQATAPSNPTLNAQMQDHLANYHLNVETGLSLLLKNAMIIIQSPEMAASPV